MKKSNSKTPKSNIGNYNSSRFKRNLYQKLYNSINTCIIVFSFTPDINDFEIIDLNKTSESLFNNKSRTEIVGKRISHIFPNHISSIIIDNFIKILRETKENELHNLNSFNMHQSIFSESYVTKISKTVVAMFCKLKDDSTNIKSISEIIIKQIGTQFKEKALVESERKFQTFINSSPIPTYILDIDGNILDANPAACNEIGYSPEELIDTKFTDYMEESYKKRFESEISSLDLMGKSFNEYTLFKKNGCKYVCNINTIKIQKNSFLVFCQDISSNKYYQEKLQQLSYSDTLTNLPNRSLFFDRLDIALKLAKRSNTKVAVAFIDIDNFKLINDILGHVWGDNFIKIVAERLNEATRDFDTVARMGGDEFAVIFQNLSSEAELIQLLKEIQSSFEHPLIINNNKMYTTVSIGVSIAPNDGDTVQELVKNADTALYNAKENGKNRIHFFTNTMKEKLKKKMEIEKRLYSALKQNELLLYYQPQFDSNNLKIRGFEALIRWNSPELGFVSPLDFISIAEESGLIIPIGEWVLKTACKTCANWQKKYNYSNLIMSVNISTIQLSDKNFIKIVKEALEESGLDPNCLELEITESTYIKSFDYYFNILYELRSLGIRISLDDFGTGYSSLSYLKHLPIDTLKIDKSFIKDMEEETIESSLTSSIIDLVKKLRLEVIAEGVETQPQLQNLKTYGCDFIQGFLLGKPVPENTAEEMFLSNLNLYQHV